jgi:hypothetical protein
LNPGTSGAAVRVCRDTPRLTATQVSGHHWIPVMTAHLPAPDHDGMDMAPALYTIRINGHLGGIMLSAFPAMTPHQHGTCTMLTGHLDRPALYGLLAQIDALGLDLLEVRQLQPDPEPPQPGDRPHHDSP